MIRKHAPDVYGLDQLIEAGVLTAGFAAVLRRAVTQHLNILVIGGPRTGKTTLANAILREIAWQCPQERIVLVEDTIELQCESRDHLGLRVREGESLAEPIKRVLRLSPDRIVVGEVRDHAAFYMLDAWLTGCPGSLATVHGSGAENALRRLDLLCQRANVPSQVPLIAAAVELIVELRREQHVRPRVVDVVRVDGLGADGRFLLRLFDPSGSEIGPSHVSAGTSRRPVRVRRAARSLLVAGCLFAITGIEAARLWAAGAGGPEMPWNAPLQNLLDNLSGPTAQTLGMLMFVVGALTWGFSRNEDHIRKFDGIVVGVAVAIGVVNLFNALAFQGAIV